MVEARLYRVNHIARVVALTPRGAAASFTVMGSSTVIGPETRLAGALYGKDDLCVEGTVDGPVHGEAKVTLTASSAVHGDVRGRDVILAGKLSHNVFATHTVHLQASGELRGDIEAPRVAIDEGAVFEGQVRMKRRAELHDPQPQPVLQASERLVPALAT